MSTVDSWVDRLAWPASPRQLALVRMATATHVAAVLASPAMDAIFTLPAHVMPWASSLLPEALERALAPHAPWLARLGLVSAALSALGLVTRISLTVTALCFFLTQNLWFRMSLFHDDWLYFNVYLVVLACSPCADAWSLDAWLRGRREPPASVRYRLPLELMTAWFAGLYVAAGLAKLFPLQKAWLWLSGARAQDFACEFMLDSPLYWLRGEPLFDYAHTRWPFALGAVFTVATELGAVTLLRTARHRRLVLPAIVGMHAGIYLLGIPGFVQASCVAMTVFVPARWLGCSEAAGARISTKMRAGA